MKKTIFNTLLFLCMSLFTLAQAPNGFKYQAVARDASNEPYKNVNMSVRISLIKDGSTGTIDYSESHMVTTSDLGVFALEIGAGTALSGFFTDVNWSDHPYYLKVDIDPTGGSSYIPMGTSQLLSVPYALYAKESGGGTAGNDNQTLSITGTQLAIEDGNAVDLSIIQDGVNDADADPNNEIQSISLSGNTLTLSNGGGSVALPGGGADDQTLTLSGTNLSIEDGNTVNLASLQDGVNDADANPNNEIQSISLSGNTLTLSNGGGSVALPSGGADDQTLTLSGTNLSIEDGNTVNLASLQDGVNDADADPNNEIQTISKAGNTVTLSNGGGSFTDDVNDADANPTNEIQTLALSGTNLSLSGANMVNLASIAAPPVWSLNGAQAYYNSGGVGVGTNAPTQPFHVKVDGTKGIRLQGNDTGNVWYTLDNGGGSHYIFDDRTDNHLMGFESATAMKFNTGGANERMRILANGFIGVGTIAPEFRLHINGEFFVNSSAGRINFGSPGDGNRWRMSTQGSGANLQFQSKPSGSNIYTRRVYFHQNGNVGIGDNSNPDEELVVGSNLGSGWAIPAITVGGTSGGAVQAGNTDYKVSMESSSTFSRARIISTSPSGFGRGEIEMRTNGIAIGENPGSPGSYMLKVEHGSFGFDLARSNSDNHWELLTSSATAGNLNLYANGSFRGYFNGTDGSYNVSSDRSLKKNIQGMGAVLSNVLQLKPARYEYIHNNPDNIQSIGFIAQEVKAIFPELVVVSQDERSKGLHAVNYAGFSTITVKAIQEQQEIIEQQQTQIDSQAQEIEALKAQLARIEALLKN